jgi:hypothetical protein
MSAALVLVYAILRAVNWGDDTSCEFSGELSVHLLGQFMTE